MGFDVIVSLFTEEENTLFSFFPRCFFFPVLGGWRGGLHHGVMTRPGPNGLYFPPWREVRGRAPCRPPPPLAGDTARSGRDTIVSRGGDGALGAADTGSY